MGRRDDIRQKAMEDLQRFEVLMLDGHFALEHTARFGSGLFFNFNGTAGIWRRSPIGPTASRPVKGTFFPKAQVKPSPASRIVSLVPMS